MKGIPIYNAIHSTGYFDPGCPAPPAPLGERKPLDESWTVAVVRLDWGAFWKVLSHFEANMGLYYCLLRLWVNLGESEFVLRSLSALAGVLAVGLVYVLGKRLFDTKVGLIGAALLATNSFHIQYSQEARAYSLMVLLTALSSLFFLRAIGHSSRNEWDDIF